MRTSWFYQKFPASDYRFAWIVAVFLALVFAPLIINFQKQYPWLIAIPLCIGGVMIVLYEFWGSSRLRSSSEHLVTLGPEYSGLVSYEQMLALEIKPPRKKVPKEQLALFPGFQEPSPLSSIRLIMDETGKEIAVLSCDRFSALLITYLLDNMDKATEKSLMAGLSRFGEMSDGKSDLKLLVHDKAVREAIKSDFRGNLVSLVSRGGEKVVKDLLKAMEAAKEAEEKSRVDN